MKRKKQSTLARVGLAILYLVGGCGVSALGLLGFIAVVATGAFRGSNGSIGVQLTFLVLCLPAVLGLAAAIYVLVKGKGRSK